MSDGDPNQRQRYQVPPAAPEPTPPWITVAVAALILLALARLLGMYFRWWPL